MTRKIESKEQRSRIAKEVLRLIKLYGMEIVSRRPSRIAASVADPNTPKVRYELELGAAYDGFNVGWSLTIRGKDFRKEGEVFTFVSEGGHGKHGRGIISLIEDMVEDDEASFVSEWLRRGEQ